VSAAAVASLLSQSAAAAGARAALTSSTIQAASRFAARQGAGAISAKVVVLSEGVLKTKLLTKTKTVTVLLAAVTLCGAAGLIYQTYAAEPAPAPAPSAGKPPARNATFIRDEERLRGTWNLAEAAWGGKKGKVEEAEASAVLTIKGETLHFQFSDRGDGNLSREDRFFVLKLDPTTTPKLINLADWQMGFEDNPNIIEGIYALDGDTLTVCFTDGSFSENNRIKLRTRDRQGRAGSRPEHAADPARSPWRRGHAAACHCPCARRYQIRAEPCREVRRVRGGLSGQAQDGNGVASAPMASPAGRVK
jgi:uncharacterized protein (TIGR03067 family)